jgi:plasmid maintenance system antidote protein VapI
VTAQVHVWWRSWTIDVAPSRISDIVNGKRPITADTALRLSIFFDMEAPGRTIPG